MAKIENNGITAQLTNAEVTVITQALRFTIDNRMQSTAADAEMDALLADFLGGQ